MLICHICSCSVLFRGSRKQLFHFCAVLSRNQPKPPKPPTPAERLKYLRSAERNVAILAGVSLVIGYFALKKAFSDMAANRAAIPLPRPLVVAGPSGSGKSTLLKKLFGEFPDEFGFSISHTSRKPRPGEKNGKEYYFSTREDMQKGIDNGEFIEWAEYSANLYGTSKKSVSDVQAQGRICVLDIDMQGVRSMKKTDLNPVYLFINPPSIEELEKRLRGRETETEESIQRRLKIAKEEMEYAKKPGVFDHFIINEIVHEAYDQMRGFLMKEIEDIRKRRGSS